MCLFFYNQKPAYELRISDWSSDVCSSDLWPRHRPAILITGVPRMPSPPQPSKPSVSKRGAIYPFYVMEVMKAAAEREAAGGEVIHMEVGQPRSAERRVGIECVSTCRSRWSACPEKNKS